MVNVSVVQRKLRSLQQYLAELQEIRPSTFEQYQTDTRTRRAVERLIQLLVEAANDINVHAAVDAGLPPPDDYFSGFITAGEIGLIPAELASQLAPAAGERNIIVHEYQLIDDRVIYESIAEALALFNDYVRAVLNSLDS